MKRIVKDAVEQARAKSALEFHRSALVELENYSRHVGVEKLEEDRLETVLSRIAELSGNVAEEGGRTRVGAADVRLGIMYLCGYTYEDCEKAAARILDEPTRPIEIAHIRAFARKAASVLQSEGLSASSEPEGVL